MESNLVGKRGLALYQKALTAMKFDDWRNLRLQAAFGQ
jgi:hypothetical protein